MKKINSIEAVAALCVLQVSTASCRATKLARLEGKVTSKWVSADTDKFSHGGEKYFSKMKINLNEKIFHLKVGCYH